MPFISDEQISKSKEIEEVQKRIEKIKENHKIQQTVEKQEKDNHKFTDSEMIKLISKQKQPKTITPSDIEKSIRLQEFINEKSKEEIKELLENKEIKEVKDEIVGVLALPMTIPQRRMLFHQKLRESETVSEYLNENVLFRWFNRANSHLKFGTIYGIKYLQTLGEYQHYLNMRKNEESLKAPPNTPTENKKDSE